MDPRYQAMMFGGQGFGGVGGENKRRRPASLLLDESPLKITLRINSLKVVAKEKDESDAISALANKIESERVAEEEEGEDESYDASIFSMAETSQVTDNVVVRIVNKIVEDAHRQKV